MVSGELDGRKCGRGSLAASGDEGRARERVKLSEMRRGVCAGHWLGGWRSGPARQRERERAGEGNWRRQIGPTGQQAREGGRARGRIAADMRGSPVRQRGRAAWLGLVGRLGCFLFFLFLWIF
jgi:hypothetical protein